MSTLMEQLAESLAAPPVPEVGVHAGVSYSDYHAFDAASNSRLSHLLQSPAHLRWYLDHPEDFSTDAKVLGNACHFAMLEPDIFASRYVRGPEGDGRTKAVQDAKARLAVDNPKATILKAAAYDCALSMRDSVWSHPRAKQLLAFATSRELSVVWSDGETGQLCKARVDGSAPEIASIIDLKTTTDASRHAFERSIFNFGYYRQGAFYLNGMHALQPFLFDHFVIIAIEKDPPYAVALYQLDDAALKAGCCQLRLLLRQYRECVQSNQWPGYDEEVQDISIPSWGEALIYGEQS